MTIEKRFIERDKNGKIIGDFACPQPGYAEEEMAEDHPDFLAYRRRPGTRELMTSEQKLATIGLTVEELKGLLAKPAKRKPKSK